MDRLDERILDLLIGNARVSFAEIGRQLNITRAHARERVQQLVSTGVVEQFTAVINPDKLGKGVSAFLDVCAGPQLIETLCAELADCPQVVSLYLMSDMQSLHVHTLTDSDADLDAFVSRYLFGREGVISVRCKRLLRRVKNRRGGPRV